MLTALLGCSMATAASTAPNAAISRGFTASDSNLVNGALVATQAGSPGTVELATREKAGRLTGIVSTTSLVELSNSNPNEVQVILSGTAVALVSDINGSIKAGDKITASPINGVGMLATTDTQIVGTAQASLDTKAAKTSTITNRSGKPRTVHIGTVPLQVGVSYYIPPSSQFLPPFLQSLANSISGRPVSPTRVLLSGVVLLLALGVVFALVYTAVRAGIISLGRNPLAAGAIQGGLINAATTVLLVVVLTITSVYLILIY